jgi:signal transduction histidine kinase
MHLSVPEETEQHLLRIAQEAVTNAGKHSRANKVFLTLHTEPDKVQLRIMDDGCGFDQGHAFSSEIGHFGLIGMRERAARIGGKLRLSSQPGKGTEVELILPLS